MPDVDPEEEIDVVVMDFAMDDFRELRHCIWGLCFGADSYSVRAATVLAPERDVRFEDFKPYAEGQLINEVFGKYAKIAW